MGLYFRCSFALFLLLFSFSFQVFCQDMKPVPVGMGSYASCPPKDNDADKLFSCVPYLEKEAQGKPLPTNDWWTTLIRDIPFPGKMWAYPLTISANNSNVLVWYPKGWSDNGTELHLGSPLTVQAIDNSPPGPDADIPVFTFEYEKWPKGWTIEGDAFGQRPMTPQEHGMDNVIGQQYACSFNNGDAGTGSALSPEFRLKRDYIHLLVAGGNNKPELGVFLEINGKTIYQALGRQDNTLRPVSWDVRKFKGQKARIRLIDTTKGGWGFIAADQIVQSNSDKPGSGGVFTHASLVRWGDWSVTMRLNAGKGKRVDATSGRGMPFCWLEVKQLDLQINTTNAKTTDLDGTLIKLPYTGSGVVVEQEGRLFGIYAPNGTEFTVGAKLQIKFPKRRKRFIIIAALPQLSDARFFETYAYAVPRQTWFQWVYDAKTGAVTTFWDVQTQALQGTNTAALQGWLPHHWRKTRNDLRLLDQEYASQRGRLRLAAGKRFRIAWAFPGVLPEFPLPKTVKGQKNPYDPKRLENYLQQWTDDRWKKPADQRYGADTYWGGKDFLKMSQAMTIAREMKAPSANKLQTILTDCLTDWFTYKQGEDAHYFAKYPSPWNGLVGFKPSYGSSGFTDNHFHYGYFTLASALLAKADPQWGKDFGPMATLVAKQYANWDRRSKDFPFLRTFEPWCGHSYAGGSANPHDGNNQESSSEAMMSWAGLFLLGAALHDKDMLACGAMGYAIESEAAQEYWNDYYGWKDPKAANHPPAFKKQHSIASVVRDRDIGHWTWFSGKPVHIYGIQWLPVWTSMHYLGRYPDHVRYQVDEMLKKEGKGKKASFASLGHDWGQVTLGYLLWGNPAEVCKVLDEEYKAKRELGSWKDAGINYYLAHSVRALGTVDWNYYTDVPTSLVFKENAKQHTAVVWNSTEKEVTCNVYRFGKVVHSFKVPQGKTVSSQF